MAPQVTAVAFLVGQKRLLGRVYLVDIGKCSYIGKSFEFIFSSHGAQNYILTLLWVECGDSKL
jgi:hypothetical protein